MTTWKAFLLGIIQGFTEFLPVSSSGHLELGQILFGLQDLHQYVLFNLICHLGTLGSIFFCFLPQIKQSLLQFRRFFQIVAGTLPLVPLVFFIKPLKMLFTPDYLGFCFLVTSGFLFAGIYGGLRRQPKPWLDPLAIGVMQAIAIFPGISRSGITICTAQLLGWKKEEAIQFSFLLAIPAILGGTIVELAQVLTKPNEGTPVTVIPCFIGFFTSFLIGCLTLRLLMRMNTQHQWLYFAWYCLFLGMSTITYFNLLNFHKT